MEETSEFLHHEACPSCDSKDNLARYTDGHGYCFGCEYFEPGDENGEPKETQSKQGPDFDPIDGEVSPLNARGIHKSTCEKWGYKCGTYKGKATNWKTRPCQIADVRDAKGRLKGQKVKLPDKSFVTLGKPADYLYGMHLWQGGRKIIITEGEIDALSFSQVQGLKYPVVSLPNGSKGGKKAIAKNLDYLSNFDEVILCFDMDDEGQDAIDECGKVLMHHNVKVIDLPLKDANDMLLAGRVRELNDAVFKAKKYQPAGLLTLSDVKDRVREPVQWGYEWFIPELTDYTYGRRLGEVYTLGAGTGVGKTDLFTQQMAYDVQVLKMPVAAFYMEMDPGELGKRFAGKVAGRTFHVPDSGWTQEEMDSVMDDPEVSDKLMLWDSWGCTDWDEIEPAIVYLASQGWVMFYVDHLTALATGADKDEKEELEDVMARIGALAKRYNIIIHLISHLTTPDKGPPHEEGGRVTIRQFKGSRAIGFWSYFIFGLERDQQNEDPEAQRVTTFRILKDRYTGQSTGETIPLTYDAGTGLIEPVSGEPETPFENQEY